MSTFCYLFIGIQENTKLEGSNIEATDTQKKKKGAINIRGYPQSKTQQELCKEEPKL